MNEKLLKHIRKLKTDGCFSLLLAVILFCGIAVLNNYFPKTCDDITFSAISETSLISLLRSALMQGNGRLLGNFFCYLIKFRWFTLIEKTAIWSGIVFLSVKLIDCKNAILNTVIAVVLIYPCDTVFAEVYAWNSGFQNYAFPVLFILFSLFVIKTIQKQDALKLRILFTVILFFSGFIGQFFSENTSLFAVCLAFVLFVCSMISKNKQRSCSFVYLIATAFGFVLMMAYPHWLGTSQKIASYREYATNLESLIALAGKNFRLIAKNFTTYFLLWIVVSVAFIILIKKLQRQLNSKGFINILLTVSKIIIAVYPFFSLFYAVVTTYSLTFLRHYNNIAVCTAIGIYVIALITVSIVFLIQKQLPAAEKSAVILFMLAGASVAPLLVVSPIGARTFYILFVFMFLSCMKIIAMNAEKFRLGGKTVSCICLVVLCSLLGVLILAEYDNKYCYHVRSAYLEQEINRGKDEITLPLLPHQNLVHEDDNRNTWKNYINRNYGKDIKLTFTDWNRWYSDFYRTPKS